MEITRYVSKEMIEDLKNHDLTIGDFVSFSDSSDVGFKLDAKWHNVPIKIIIPDKEE